MVNLLLGFCIMLISLLMQAILFVVVIRFYMRRRDLADSTSFFSSLSVVAGVLLLLVTGALIQIGIWASMFCVLGEFSEFTEAFYHSAVNFSTLGYGDFVMSDKHRLLGPLEAVNGVLMIGVSTSALTLSFQDIIKKSLAKKHTHNE